MKTKYALLTGFVMLAASITYGQAEQDDMYFNAKDRAKLNATNQVILAKQYKQEDLMASKVAPINPTDSYSGRSVNPEYTNRLKVNPGATNNDPQYFVSGYQPTNFNQVINKNGCNCGSGNYFNNPYYGGGFGMGSYGMYPGMYSGFGSPFSSFYSPWGFGNGFYQPGLSTMMGYGFGGMYPGMFGSMGYGFGSGFGSPYGYGFGSPFYNSFGYGYGMPYHGYGSGFYGYNNYNTTYVSSGADHNPVVTGKRTSRSSDSNNLIDHSRQQTAYTRNGRTVATGRTRSESQTQYYDRGWKRDPNLNPSRSFWSDNNSTGSSRSSWSNGSWGNTTGGRQNSSTDWGNSRSSFNSGGAFGGTRSSGGSFGGSMGGHSGGGGHSRGRD